MKRIAYFSHGHPKYTKGGAENFAYDLFSSLNSSNRASAWYFMASRMLDLPGGTNIKNFAYKNKSEISKQLLVRMPEDGYDHFFHRNLKGFSGFKRLREFLTVIAPEVFHIQHYLGFGLPLIHFLKKSFPSIPIVMTLHDYYLICPNDGKILSQKGEICSWCDSYKCSTCYPVCDKSKFDMRESFVRNLISFVDLFICPSYYLLERYHEWGIQKSKLVYCENGRCPCLDQIKAVDVLSLRPSKREDNDGEVVFAYFGQLQRVKGIFVLLKAIELLPKEAKAVFYINGPTDGLSEDEQSIFFDFLTRLKKRVVYNGEYSLDNIPHLMQGVDWVICPSIWPENSPLVVQEAFMYGKPVICPSTGAFPEKVQHAKTGLFFKNGDFYDLSRVLILCIKERGLCPNLSAQILQPYSIASCLDKHLDLYENLTGVSDGN